MVKELSLKVSINEILNYETIIIDLFFNHFFTCLRS